MGSLRNWQTRSQVGRAAKEIDVEVSSHVTKYLGGNDFHKEGNINLVIYITKEEGDEPKKDMRITLTTSELILLLGDASKIMFESECPNRKEKLHSRVLCEWCCGEMEKVKDFMKDAQESIEQYDSELRNKYNK